MLTFPIAMFTVRLSQLEDLFDLRLAAAAADLMVDREDALGAPSQIPSQIPAADLLVDNEDALGATMTGTSPSACALSGPSPCLPSAIRILSSLMQTMATSTTASTATTVDAAAAAAAAAAATATTATAMDVSTTDAVTDTVTTTTTTTATMTMAGARAALFQTLQTTAPCLSSSSSSSDTLAETQTNNAEAIAIATSGGVTPWGWDQDAWLVFAACEIGSAEGKRRLDRWWSHFLQVSINMCPTQYSLLFCFVFVDFCFVIIFSNTLHTLSKCALNASNFYHFLQVFDHPTPSTAVPSQMDSAPTQMPSQMPGEFTAKVLSKRLRDVAAALRCAPPQVPTPHTTPHHTTPRNTTPHHTTPRNTTHHYHYNTDSNIPD